MTHTSHSVRRRTSSFVPTSRPAGRYPSSPFRLIPIRFVVFARRYLIFMVHRCRKWSCQHAKSPSPCPCSPPPSASPPAAHPRAAAASIDAGRVLDPAERLRKADPGLPGDERRQGRQLQPVLRALRRTEPRRRQRAACRRRQLLARNRDVEQLVKAGLVSPSWNQNATHGFVTNSVVVIIVRKGNPKHITGWCDLVKPGVQVADAEPVHLRQRPLEHNGRVRRAAEGRQDPSPGTGVPEVAVRKRGQPGQLGQELAADVQRRPG